MPYTTEDNLNLLITCIQCGELQTDLTEVAKRLGLPSGRSAGDRVKALIKAPAKVKGSGGGHGAQGVIQGKRQAEEGKGPKEAPRKRTKKVTASVEIKEEQESGDADDREILDGLDDELA